MMRRAALAFWATWAALSIALGAGCSRRPSAPETDLRMQIGSEPISLDPALAEDGSALRILANVMDGLVGYDGAGKLENRLAESFRISDNGLRYEFTIRPDAFWSDGKKVEAADFIQAFRRTLSPHTASKVAVIFASVIRGGDAYLGGKSRDLPGVREEGGKLVFELERPAGFFLQALSLSEAAPERADVLAANGGRWPETGPVTGPYRIARHVPDSEIVLEKNPRYYGNRSGPARVRLLIVADESTAAALFDQGRVDILDKVPELDMQRLKAKGVIHVNPFVAVYYIGFNVKKPPFNRREWRQAVAGAIRKDEIVAALGTGELAATSWIPRGIEGYYPYVDERPRFRGAMEAVRAQQASPRAFRGTIEAGFDSSSRNSLVMEKIQQDVQRELGLRLTLNNSDWKTYVKSLQADAPPIFRFGWLAPFLDPIMHLRVFMTGNPNNYSGFSNAEYDALVQKIEALNPGPGRESSLRRAQEILVDDEAVVVPIFHYVQVDAVSPRVENFRANPFGVIRFSELRIAL